MLILQTICQQILVLKQNLTKGGVFWAMRPKKIVELEIKIIERLLVNPRLSDDEAHTIASDYWNVIKDDLKSHNCISDEVGQVYLQSKGKAQTRKAECLDEITVLDEKEKDRRLDNESKRAAIKANKIAVWAIVISILAATGLPQWILQWLYEQVSCTLGLQ